jgi:hypothetical protein
MLNDEFKIGFFEGMWYSFTRWFTDWIYPAYNVRNLFKRHDLVKLPHIKPWEYSDISEKMLYANFELIKEFIEKEHPEKHICWYTDPETGEELGHKYGECDDIIDKYSNLYPTKKIMFPELKGSWIMDIIKEIYEFYTIQLPKYESDKDYLFKIFSEYVCSATLVECKDKPDVYEFEDLSLKYTVDSPEIQNLNWDILSQYFPNKESILNKDAFNNALLKLNMQIEDETRIYLLLAIEVRPYLWT